MNFRPEYLFVRILEACNAECFMCPFAASKDSFRYEPALLERHIAEVIDLGVKYCRFTGGEPLIHRDILKLVSVARDGGMRTSLITNGHNLPEMATDLRSSGLEQVIVSLDSHLASQHDTIRKTEGLHRRAVAGIVSAKKEGLLVRVSTVIGAHNFRCLPDMQRMLGDLDVDQWEVNSIKGPYKKAGHTEEIEKMAESIYASDRKLTPIGKRWFGETIRDTNLFFESGILPRPSSKGCHVAGRILYLDSKNQQISVCSCLPHSEQGETSVPFLGSFAETFRSLEFQELTLKYQGRGGSICETCSTSLACMSDRIMAGQELLEDWSL